MSFQDEIKWFRETVKGKTIKRDGEVWLYGGNFAHNNMLVLTFYIPSNRSSKEALHKHVFVHTLMHWEDCGSVEFVPIPEDNQERIDKLINGIDICST